MAEGRGIWIYAVAPIVRREWFGEADGVGNRPVWPVFAAGLAAAVSGVNTAEYGPEAVAARLENLDRAEDRTWAGQMVQRHQAVIEKIAAHQPVMPMRLATLRADEAEVAALLAERSAELSLLFGPTPCAQWVGSGSSLDGEECSRTFENAVRELADHYPALRIEPTVPWPPYRFAGSS